jgi:enoyl-CoA hydratase
VSTIRLRIADGVACVTLADADRRNAISMAMVDEIGAAFDSLEADPEVRAVVVTGDGPAFCAGADLELLARGDRAEYRRLYESFLRVARCPLPTIAAVNGPATGAGANLALACDVRLAAPEALFSARFLDVGLHPGGGHTWMLQQAVGRQRATAMVVFGEELDGAAAVAAGLALRCVDRSELVDEALSMARRAARAPRELIVRVKGSMSALATGPDDDLDRAVAIEGDAQAWSTEQEYFHDRMAAIRRRVSSATKPDPS